MGWSDSTKLIFYSLSIEVLLILLIIFIYQYIGNMDDYPTFNYLSLIFGICAFPISMPILSLYYARNTTVADDLENLYDQIYCIMHFWAHSEEYEPTFLYKMKEKKNENLLLQIINTPILEKHDPSKFECIQYQFNYFKKNLSQKKQYIDKITHSSIFEGVTIYGPICYHIERFQPSLCTKSALIVGFTLYLISRFYIIFILPYWWFLSIYVGKVNQYKFCTQSKIECGENIFITLIIIFLILSTFIFLRATIRLLRLEYFYGYLITNIATKSDKDKHDDLLRILKRNEAIYQSIQYDIAMIVCIFLGDE